MQNNGCLEGKAATAKGFAKLNLYLEIGAKQPNGYHPMTMVNLLADLYDQVTVFPIWDAEALPQAEHSGLPVIDFQATPREEVECPLPHLDFLPADQNKNLAVQAARLFLEAVCPYGSRPISSPLPPALGVRLQKAIPAQAGMGGGSADGGAVLLALNRLFGNPFSCKELAALSLPLGADLPYAILGQVAGHSPALVQGVGEQITPLNLPQGQYALVLCKPSQGVRTKAAFEAVDTARQQATFQPAPKVEALVQALADPSGRGLQGCLYNRFAESLPLPQVEALVHALKAKGAIDACMTGSGSAVIGIFGHKATAFNAAQQLKNTGVWATTASPFSQPIA